MPSQKQLRWSELRVGITVVVASVVLAILIFLMSGTGGFLTRKITLVTYFDNAEGLRDGEPVDLQGVPIGNVATVRVVPDRPKTPVRVTMKIQSNFAPMIHKDSTATVETAGVLGESFVDIQNQDPPRLPPVKEGDELPHENAPGISDVVRSSQGTLVNMDKLVSRLDRIVSEIESGNGTLHGVIYDPTLINKVNALVNQIQELVADVSNGKGTIGKFFADDTLYRKADDAVDKLDRIVDDINNGKGTAGKLIKDETLYNNLNQTVTKANKLIDDINAGKGAIGMMAKDQEFARKLRNTIDKVSLIADQLESGKGSAGKFLKDPSMYNNTDQLLLETRNLVKAIRENPKKYLTIRFRVF
ncbi:MAG TPA: MlaD family protein [Verrucomicrobiae bacterium]|nr:MlaD family protein [Verrucomicrobiae bacterium]